MCIRDRATGAGRIAEFLTNMYGNWRAAGKPLAKLIDDQIKPAVASDGGNIVFQSYDQETKNVNVSLIFLSEVSIHLSSPLSVSFTFIIPTFGKNSSLSSSVSVVVT